MSEAPSTAEALDLLFTSAIPGWFSPFATATDSLTAGQAATVPAPRFNSVWAVVNHVRYWQEVALLQLQHLPVDSEALGSGDGSGWPPLCASGLKLHDRLTQISNSLARVEAKKGGLPPALHELHHLLTRDLKKTEAVWPAIEQAYALVHQATHVLANYDKENHRPWQSTNIRRNCYSA